MGYYDTTDDAAGLEKAVKAVETRIDEQVGGYKREVAQVKERMKELEQSGVAGFKGGSIGAGMESGQLSVKVRENAEVSAFLKGEAARAKASVESGLFVKNTITGDTDTVLVEPERQAGIVPGAFRPLTLLDFVPTGSTSSNRVDYTRENSWTNNAEETAENAEKPESDAGFELVEDPVRTIPHWLKTSKQVLDDQAALAGYLDRRLRHGVRARLQRQIVQGDGAGSNLAGITSAGRHTAFNPEAGDTALDSINRAKWEVVASDYTPSFVMLHPRDVGMMERMKSDGETYVAADGLGARFIERGYGGQLWELPIVPSADIPEGEFILGDAQAMQLWIRQDATVEMFEQDSDDVQHNRILIRGELRAAFGVLVPAAILYGDLVNGS